MVTERTLLLTSLDVAHNIPLQNVAMARNHWIPEHLHRPARHEDREHHANVDEDVQYDEDREAPFPVLARRHAHEHDGHGDFASRLGRGRELKGNPCELHGIHDVVRVQRGGMPSQAVVSRTSQKTESATQEDLTDFCQSHSIVRECARSGISSTAYKRQERRPVIRSNFADDSRPHPKPQAEDN